MIIEIEDKVAFENALKKAGDKLVVVDFTATWCGPCRIIGPYFEELSKDPMNCNVVFLKVDVDVAQDVAHSCDITCMPTFHFYKKEKKVHEFSGASHENLMKYVTNFR
ncbi:hypothetical protein AOLI_G00107100 [Acnodon oligacanthus]